MRFALIFLGLALPTLLWAQAPPQSTLAQLEARTQAGGDTLYVLNFWATWCRPCVEEMPYFDQISQDYAARPLKVIFVSLDLASEYTARLPQFLKKRKFHAEVLWLDEPKIQTKIDSVSTEWTGSIPATLFVWNGRNLRKFHEGDYDLAALKSEIEAMIQ